MSSSVTPDLAERTDAATPQGKPRSRRPALTIVLALGGAAVAGITAASVWAALTIGTKATQPGNGGVQHFGAQPTKGAASPANPFAGLPKLPHGKPAPAFSAPGLTGGQVSLSQFRGKPTVINFFASWCPNCRAELGAFAAVSKQYGTGVNFVGVDTNDTAAKAVAMLRSAGITYPIASDPSANIASSYQVVGLPTTVFVSPGGQIVGEAFGAQTTATLHAWMAKLAPAR